MAPLFRRGMLACDAGGLRRWVVVAVLASGAMLVAFQLHLAVKQTALPPWMTARLGQEGRESRTERAHRIMERQIFRDKEEADHRHDDPTSSGSSHKLLWFFTNGTEWPRPSSKLSRLGNVWPDPQSPHDDRIVAQLMYLPPGYKAQPKSIKGDMLPTIPPVLAGRRRGEWPHSCRLSNTALEKGGQSRAVREESREVRSYAAAVKTNLPESNTADPGLQPPSPAPRQSPLPLASSPRSSPPAAPPAAPTEDAREALITSLLAALQAVGNYPTEDHPMRAVCLQAVGVQPGAPKKD
ncbi:uncharacterized protein LOC125757365 [Rhipicephalus sanguineus]|uniref:uncharacterized protein LOC125757365 n=1 Tax=Rhipicephalus sanguineus TaxID=34632 RepID=UPI0020C5711B|nr:uncharacterized protein LOC125757365 [Rhipicephalus sanguineus]